MTASHLNYEHGPADPRLAAIFQRLRALIDGNGARGETLACLRAEIAPQDFQLQIVYRLTGTPTSDDDAGISRQTDRRAPPRDDASSIDRALRAWTRAPERTDALAARARSDPAACWHDLPGEIDFGTADAGSEHPTLRVTGEREDRLVFPTDDIPAPFQAVMNRLAPADIAENHAEIAFAGTRVEDDALVLVFSAHAFYGEIDAEVRRPGRPLEPLELRVAGEQELLLDHPKILDRLMDGIARNLEAGSLVGARSAPLLRDLARTRNDETSDNEVSADEALTARWNHFVSPAFLARLRTGLRHARRQRRRRFAGSALALAGALSAPLAVLTAPATTANAVIGPLTAIAAVSLPLAGLAAIAAGRVRPALESLMLAALLAGTPLVALQAAAGYLPERPIDRRAALAAILAPDIADLPEIAPEPIPASDPNVRLRGYLRQLDLIGPDASAADVRAALRGLHAALPSAAARRFRDEPAAAAEAVALDKVSLQLTGDRALFTPALPETVRLRLTANDTDALTHALERAVSANAPVLWFNGTDAHRGQIVPVERQRSRASICLVFDQRVATQGRTTPEVRQTACRRDGRWHPAD